MAAAARAAIGVLAVQGAVEPHLLHLRALDLPIAAREVRCVNDFEALSGLILPGGESTAMLRLLEHAGLEPALARAAASIPIWGVCAGAILLGQEVRPEQRAFRAMDMSIERNAYGRQLESFVAPVCDYPVAFIRAPKVARHGAGVSVRARHGGHPVWLEQGLRWATTFHPELSLPRPSPFHAEFARRCLAFEASSKARAGALSLR